MVYSGEMIHKAATGVPSQAHDNIRYTDGEHSTAKIRGKF